MRKLMFVLAMMVSVCGFGQEVLNRDFEITKVVADVTDETGKTIESPEELGTTCTIKNKNIYEGENYVEYWISLDGKKYSYKYLSSNGVRVVRTRSIDIQHWDYFILDDYFIHFILKYSKGRYHASFKTIEK